MNRWIESFGTVLRYRTRRSPAAMTEGGRRVTLLVRVAVRVRVAAARQGRHLALQVAAPARVKAALPSRAAAVAAERPSP